MTDEPRSVPSVGRGRRERFVNNFLQNTRERQCLTRATGTKNRRVRRPAYRVTCVSGRTSENFNYFRPRSHNVPQLGPGVSGDRILFGEINSRIVVDVPFLRALFVAMVGWWDRQQQAALAYLIEKNRILRG